MRPDLRPVGDQIHILKCFGVESNSNARGPKVKGQNSKRAKVRQGNSDVNVKSQEL